MTNKYCPLCGEVNGCRSSAGEHGNCWCDMEEFPKEIFELVPVESIRIDCIM
ncbi:cysteine-rich CWC family protein [Bacillus sp. JJ1533]|uniref:cysteine-rich CWC family protein n=1 Tax=Bacillus sp. JJ1533 TaxID=3122959 RepID=UPI002FFFD39C